MLLLIGDEWSGRLGDVGDGSGGRFLSFNAKPPVAVARPTYPWIGFTFQLVQLFEITIALLDSRRASPCTWEEEEELRSDDY